MANRLKGEASFTVDGETFTLVFDAGAFLEIEDRTGFGFIAMFGQLGAFERDQTKVKLGFLTTLIQCGLAAHHPDIDRDTVADMLLQHMPVVTGALGEALAQAMPRHMRGEAGAADADPQQAAKAAGTGKKSSDSGAKPDRMPKHSGGRRRG